MPMSMKQIKAIEAKNKKRILELEPTINEESGIYIFCREEDGIKYAYVGQAKHLLSRAAQHLSGYQHIDLSLKKHKFWSEENPAGWRLCSYPCDEDKLDAEEQRSIRECAAYGFQLLNKTAGGQGVGKKEIAETRPRKTYRDGLAQGYKNAQKEIGHLFDLHLKAEFKKEKPTKNAIKAMQKFKEFIGDKNEN